MTPEEALEANFRQVLELPEDAITYLIDLWHFIQVMDDFADGDEVAEPDFDKAIHLGLVGMGSNPFFDQHRLTLFPALTQMILKWQASNIAERAEAADARSYMWRAGYYDVVCLVTHLVHPRDGMKATQALSLYGEGFFEYMKEFGNA